MSHSRRLFSIAGFIAALAMNLMPFASASAITADDKNAVIYNWPFYQDCDPSSGDDSGGGATGGTAENGQDVFNFLVNKGLSYNQAAGIIGNLMQESSLNPKSVQPGGAGRGIAQWSEPGRWDGVKKLAASENVGPFTLGVQLDYLWKELNGSYKHALIDLKKQTSVQSATESFEKNYEAAGTPNMPNRIQFAKDAYDKFKPNAPPENIQAPPSGGDTAADDLVGTTDSCSGGNQYNGTAGVNGWELSGANGMVYYKQTDPKWADSSYGSSTIGTSGCAPTSMAMVVATLTGNSKITPETIANKYASHYHAGEGSDWGIFPDVAGDYGITSKDIGLDFDAAAKAIKAGGLVIISVDPGFFTNSGHIMVIRAITDDGKGFYLANPLGLHNDTPYTPAFLKAQGAAKNMWTMTK
jgi:hypothetical protein